MVGDLFIFCIIILRALWSQKIFNNFIFKNVGVIFWGFLRYEKNDSVAMGDFKSKHASFLLLKRTHTYTQSSTHTPTRINIRTHTHTHPHTHTHMARKHTHTLFHAKKIPLSPRTYTEQKNPFVIGRNSKRCFYNMNLSRCILPVSDPSALNFSQFVGFQNFPE